MSLSIWVYGVIPADEKWNDMMCIYKKCMEMDADIPKQVYDYLDLDEGPPSEDGRLVEIPLDQRVMETGEGKFSLSDLPPGVKEIKVTVS